MRHSRSSRIDVLMWTTLVCLVIAASPVFGAKQCYDCHKKQQAEFSARKNVHQPVRDQNCESCHKRHGFANKLILVDDTPQLCYACHPEAKEKFSSGAVHFPVEKGACWDCHDPHSSDKQALLRTGPEGADDPNACLACHKEDLSAALSGTVPHPPFAKLDCIACHEAHNSEHPSLLKAAPRDLCATCHKVSDKKIQAAHAGKHTDNLACSDCHSGHSTSTRGLMSETAHAPFASGDCETCHSLPDAGGKVAFAEGVTPGNLCANCHSEQAEGIKKAFPHAAVEQANCDNCHSPHASRYPHLLKEEQSRICAECHADVFSAEGHTPHMPVISGDCGACHDVHGSDHKALLKKTDASLCLDCHKDYATKRDAAVSQHAGADDCLQCHVPHQGKVEKLLRKPSAELCGDCHQPDEASAGMPAKHPPYIMKDCGACHSPHFSDQEHLIRQKTPELCNQCHPEIINRTKMSVSHPPAAEDCLGCHKPHYSKELNLLTDREQTLCLGCHDSTSLNLNKAFVHTPAADGDCTGCHNPHGAMKEKLITGRAQKVMVNNIPLSRTPTITKEMSSLCYTCHESLAEKFRRQGVHKPVELGNCDACHVSHGSDHAAFVKDAPAALCGSCHALDQTLSEKHGNYDLTSANCLDCHNPHISEKPKLVRANSHPPFEEKSCESCHALGADGKVQLNGAVNEVCAACHDQSKESAMSHLHPPFEAGECTSCHSAHASDFPKFLRHEGNALCATCHSDVRQLAKEPVQHKPFADGKCMDCHQPHASNNPKLTNKPAESFCLNCHTDLKKQMKDGGVVHTPARTGQCLSCHVAHAGKEIGLLTKHKQQLCADCHDPRSAALATAHQGFPMAEANCQNCHAPHVGGKNSKALLLPNVHKPFVGPNCGSCHQPTGQRELLASTPRDLCLGCHEPVKNALTKAVVHAPMKTADGCIACHGPHVGFGKSLQNKEGVQTCLTCHHTPEFTSELKHPPAFEDCTTCHSPHSGDSPALLTNADIMDLCQSCHDDAVKKHFHPMGDKATDPLTKQPLNCIGCHTPHSSAFKPLLIADKTRKLCVLCHDPEHE